MGARNTSGLKRGNTVNTGRKRSAVRKTHLKTAEDGAKYLADVAAGKAVILVPPRYVGGAPTFRHPSHDERVQAIKEANKSALGTADGSDLGDAVADAVKIVFADPAELGCEIIE